MKALQEFLYSIKFNSNFKKIFFLIKIFVSLLILILIFKKIDWQKFIITFKQFKLRIIFQLIFIEAIRVAIQITNWRNNLKISRIEASWGLILKTYFLGSAFRFIVPGGHGIYGIVFYFRNKKLKATVAITLMRFFQTWSIFLFSLVGLYFYKFSYTFLVIIFAVLFFLPIIIPLIIKKLAIFPKEITEEFRLNYDKLVINVIFLQITSIMLFVFEYYVLLQNFMKIDFIKIFIGTPMILLAQTIPISYSGLGISEGFAIKVLSRFGVPADISVALSLMIFFISSFLPGVVGLVLFIKNKKRQL